MEKKVKKSLLTGVPAWALSFLTLTFLIVLVFILKYYHLLEYNAIEIGLYLFYSLFLPIVCFLICKTDPKGIWYTPFICNGMFLFILIIILINLPSDPESLIILIFMGSVFVLSVLGAIVGARIGRRKQSIRPNK